MTNLSLPALTYANLDRLLGKRASKTIGYATVVHRAPHLTDSFGKHLVVTHHGNQIASLTSYNVVAVSKAGWDSNTTAHRLHRILKDNGIAESVGVRKGCVSILRDRAIRPLLSGVWAIWKNGSLVESSLDS
jgi:hypothetical protein